DGLMIAGFAALPTLTRANALGQYLFVNDRPVRDKLLVGAVRAAYADYLPRDRHPIVALFVSIDPREVDVNVHPAKSEVRFREPGLVRALMVRALQEGLARETKRAATTVGGATVTAFRPAVAPRPGGWDWTRSPARPLGRGGAAVAGFAEAAQAAFATEAPTPDARAQTAQPAPARLDKTLHTARAQLHET